MGPWNRFQGMNSASLCSLAGRYENPIPPRCLAPIDFLKIPAQSSAATNKNKAWFRKIHDNETQQIKRKLLNLVLQTTIKRIYAPVVQDFYSLKMSDFSLGMPSRRSVYWSLFLLFTSLCRFFVLKNCYSLIGGFHCFFSNYTSSWDFKKSLFNPD